MKGSLFDLEDLAKFLVKAKKATYASKNSDKITPERPGFDELVYSEGDFSYRDSYCGFFQAPGMEVVRFKGIPVWTMSYSGGMLPKFEGDVKFAKQTFGFLKEALKLVPLDKPYRGPTSFEKGKLEKGLSKWLYINIVKGDMQRFIGHETIYRRETEVFSQDYMGGLVLDK